MGGLGAGRPSDSRSGTLCDYTSGVPVREPWPPSVSLVRLGFGGGFHRVWRPYIGFPVPQGLRPPQAVPISCMQLWRQSSQRSLRALALDLPPPSPSGLTAGTRLSGTPGHPAGGERPTGESV